MLKGVAPGRSGIILAFLLLSNLYFLQIYPRFLSPNELSRLLLCSAVVDFGTFQIDQPIRLYADTEDKAVYQGHFYSDKAIGTSLLGIPFYGLYALLKSCFQLQWPIPYVILWMRIFTVLVPSLFLYCLLSRFWQQIDPHEHLIPWFLILFAFGTTAFAYSNEFVSHHLAGVFFFGSFYFLFQFKQSGRMRPLVFSGLLAGMSLTVEYPAVFPVAALLGYLIWISPEKKKTVWWILCTVPFLMIMLGYNYAIFGTPFDVTYRHMAESHFSTNYARGFVGLTFPRLPALYDLLLSPAHGAFFWSPALLFAIPGVYKMIRSSGWYKEGMLFLAIALSYMLFHAGLIDWIGGATLGPRYLAAINPFLVTPVLFFFSEEKIRASAGMRFTGLLVGALSILMIVIGTITFPYPPPEMRFPFFHLHLTLLAHGVFGMSLGNLVHISSYGTVAVFFVLLLVTGLFMFPTHPPLRLPALAFTVAIGCLLVTGLLAGPPGVQDRFAVARTYFLMGRNDDARRELQEALTLQPDEKMKQILIRSLERLDQTSR